MRHFAMLRKGPCAVFFWSVVKQGGGGDREIFNPSCCAVLSLRTGSDFYIFLWDWGEGDCSWLQWSCLKALKTRSCVKERILELLDQEYSSTWVCVCGCLVFQVTYKKIGQIFVGMCLLPQYASYIIEAPSWVALSWPYGGRLSYYCYSFFLISCFS